MAGPKLVDPSTLYQAGIDPKTRLPLKFVQGLPSELKQNLKRFFKTIDRQDAVNRYKWYNLPCDISGQELERMLYLKGQLAFFYVEGYGFMFTPYALDGTIDFYGRFNSIHPVPFNNGGDDSQLKVQREVLSKIKLDVKYDILDEDATFEDMTQSAVILWDYGKDLSETIIPRTIINDAIVDCMAECVPYLRTYLLNSCGVKGVRVNDADQSDSVKEASRSVHSAAMEGQSMIPIVGNVEFQELAESGNGKAEEYMLALQSLDNLRLSAYGLENGGVFEKKAHTLQSEQDMNTSNVGLVYQDGLSLRQNFCNIVNSIWGLGIWCEPSESVLGVDQDGDGAAYDRNDTEQSGHGGNEDANSNDAAV